MKTHLHIFPVFHSTGTTETPYIYAQINLALYYEKVNPAMALYIMRDIQKLVEKTPVPRTKQFYNINLAMRLNIQMGYFLKGL